jgi:beta-phosphoglucomutase-like phosphatase (HAD superfamily)
MDMFGLIFDFNGTLYWDTWQNRESWRSLSRALRRTQLSDEELDMLNGRTNASTIEYILGYPPSPRIIEELSAEKEKQYIRLCMDRNDRRRLAPGARTLLDECVERGVPIAIATSCGAGNLARYKEWFDLATWFSDDRIVYDRGTFPGKPHPAVYLETARRLEMEPSQCIVFEDTRSGIESARCAGVGEIWAVNSDFADIRTTASMEGVVGIITDFSLFEFPDQRPTARVHGQRPMHDAR